MTKKQSTKNGSTKGKAEGSKGKQSKTVAQRATDELTARSKQADIEKRAYRIIQEPVKYDYDTREAVWLALKNRRPADVAEAVRRAEEHDPAPSGAGDEYDNSARAVFNLLHVRRLPDFISNAIYAALKAAEGLAGRSISPNNQPELEGGISLHKLAYIFKRHEAASIEFVRKPDLPELLTAALNHPDMPVRLFNDIHDGINSLTFDGQAQANIHHIRWALDVEAKKRGGAR